jgi:hypothetical protein
MLAQWRKIQLLWPPELGSLGFSFSKRCWRFIFGAGLLDQ